MLATVLKTTEMFFNKCYHSVHHAFMREQQIWRNLPGSPPRDVGGAVGVVFWGYEAGSKNCELLCYSVQPNHHPKLYHSPTGHAQLKPHKLQDWIHDILIFISAPQFPHHLMPAIQLLESHLDGFKWDKTSSGTKHMQAPLGTSYFTP